MSRNLKDTQFQTTKALPAAAATNYHASMDLGQTTKADVESFELLVTIPATPALVEDKTIVLTVQDSADDSSFTSLGISKTITGAYGGGAAADTWRVALPSTCRRYVRIAQTVESGGGTNTGVTITADMVF